MDRLEKAVVLMEVAKLQGSTQGQNYRPNEGTLKSLAPRCVCSW